MAIKNGNVTLDGSTYDPGTIERVAAQLVNENDNTFSGTLNYIQKVTKITGAAGSTTLTNADSGTVYFVDNTTAAHTFTLPALKAGFHIKIIVTVLSDNDVIVTAPADNMITSTRQFTASGAAESAVTDTYTTVTINADTVNAVVGTRADIFCDGTNYFYLGDSSIQSNTAAFVGS